MKINCPKCKKPFQISSRRLSGQVVKIRCSSCGTVFKVRGRPRTPAVSDGKGAGPAAKAPVAQDASQPIAVAAVAWFAVVGRKQVGPFGEAALQRLVRGGKVLPSTKLWRKGLDAWVTAGHIDELQTWFPAAEPVFVAPAPAPAPAPTQAEPLAPPRPALPPKLPPGKKSAPEPEPSAERSPESTDDALGDWHEDATALEQAEEVASGFFDAGEELEVEAEDQERKMEAIDFGEPEIEPISLEEAGVARGARETLRDFSVMARLSGRSRLRKTVILMVLGVFFAGALATVFVMGKEFVFTGKQRELTREQSDEDLAIFAKQSASRNQLLLNRPGNQRAEGSRGDPLDDEEEWGTLDDSDLAALEQRLFTAGIVEDVAIDREHMRKNFENGQGTKKRDARRKTPRKDEMTHWGDASSRVGGDRSAIDLSDMVPQSTKPKTHLADGIAITAKSKVVDQIATAGGGFLDDGSITEDRVKADVKERKSSGKLWKLRAKTKVMRKVRAQTKKIKTCADVAQVESGVKIFLHVGLDGRVSSISSTKGGSRFTACLMNLFGNFRVVERRLDKRIKMPVILRLE